MVRPRTTAVVRAVNGEAFLVGEVWDAALPWLRGDQFDSTMNYPIRTAILRYAGIDGVTSPIDSHLDGAGFLNAVDRVRATYPEPIHDFLYNLLGSHDEVRPLTAVGDDRRALAVAAALLYALPGIVSVYYGDEVGMAGGKDPLNRGGMVWDSKRQDRRLLQLFRRLGGLRRDVPALRVGTYRRLSAMGEMVAFAREVDAQRVVVLANAGKDRVELGLAEAAEMVGGEPEVFESFSYERTRSQRSGSPRSGIALQAQSVALLRARS